MTDKVMQYAEELYPKFAGLFNQHLLNSSRKEAFLIGLQLGAEFSEWASVEGWGYDKDDKVWRRYTLADDFPMGGIYKLPPLTTPELIDLFLTHKMKEK